MVSTVESTSNNFKVISKLVLEDYTIVKELIETHVIDHISGPDYNPIELVLTCKTQLQNSPATSTTTFKFSALNSIYNTDKNIFYVIFTDKVVYTNLSSHTKGISGTCLKPIKWVEKKLKKGVINNIFKYMVISDKLIMLDKNNNLIEII